MDFSSRGVLIPKFAMSNKYTTKEDFLDILFRDRNKAYGAYALRKTYDGRLQTGLGISLGVPLLIFLISIFTKQETAVAGKLTDDEVKVKTIVLPNEQQKKEENKAVKKTSPAQTKYSEQVKI